LAVSTFPFLAVLLCAMGSLILILLVMDRKAHQAALARARREAARLVEESAHNETARRAELEQKQRQARDAWEQKRDALHANLSREQIELQMQMRKVRDQLSQIAARLRYEQDTSTELRHKVQNERERLKTEQDLLDTLRTTAEQTGEQSKESNKTLQRMTADLLQMEQALKDLKAARQREQHTFSVVPYHGRRGESRRPIYVECTADDVIFHPERRVMPVTSREFLLGHDRPANTPDDVRAEVERRIARQRAKMADASNATPYLLLLVRPDGIGTYCHLQAVLKDMTLDFGYEFIDADWVLDFPADDEQPSAQPWMAATRTPASSPAVSAVPSASGERARPIGLAPLQAPSASSGAVVQGIRTGAAPGSGQWLRGGAGQAGGGSSSAGPPGASGPFAAGSGTGTSGPLASGGVPGGTGSSSPTGVRFLGSTVGMAGTGAGGGSLSGTPGLAVGPMFNQTGQPGGPSSGVVGQAGGSGSSPGNSSGGGGDGTGQAGSGSILGRSSGRGHPAALAPSLGGGEGEPGTSDGGGSSGGDYVLKGTGRVYAPGSPMSGVSGGYSSDAPGLGPPRALASNTPGNGYPGNGAPGNGVPGNGASGTGYPSNGTPGNGTPGNGYPGNGALGNGAPGNGTPGKGVPGNGTPGTGYPDNGAPGNGTPGNGVPGNGAWNNGTPGNGVPGNGSPGNGTPGNGAPGNGAPGNGYPGNGAPGNGAPIPPGVSPDGRYAVARANGGEGTGQPGGSTGTSTGIPGRTSPGTSPVRGTVGSGGPTAGTPGVMGQGGTRGSPSGPPGTASAGPPGTMGGTPGDGSRRSPGGDGSAAFAAVDPLAPQPPPGSRPPPGGADEQPDNAAPARPPDDPPPGGPTRRRLVPVGGGSGERGEPGSATPNRFATPTAGQQPRRPAPSGLRPAWVHGGRDWTIYVECRPDAVVLYPSEKTFTVAQAASDAASNPLVAAIQQMIERRQTARRPGEPPFYPKVCLLVRPENLRTFLTVYPALEALPAPKTRQNLDPDDDVGDIVRGANP